MWIFVAEAIGALSLLLFIVWWTLGPTQRREQDELRRLADEESTRGSTREPTPRPASTASSDPPSREG